MDEFDEITIAALSGCPPAHLDDLPYGVIGLSPDGLVEVYNATESKYAGLPVDKVLGSHFFHNIAQCMNNFLVAQRFIDEPELDATFDYVLTFRMRPTPVKMRLLKSRDFTRHYLLIDRRR